MGVVTGRAAAGPKRVYNERFAVERVAVSPETAREWLALSAGNRRIHPTAVASLVAAISNGLWRNTAQGIVFDWFGRLIDGHHRLEAIVRSGRAVEVRVTYGEDPTLVKLYDKGSKRGGGDYLEFLFGDDVNGKQMAAMINVLAMVVTGKQVRLDEDGYARFFVCFEDGLKFAERFFPAGSRLTKPFRAAAISAAFAFAYRSDPSGVELAARYMVDGGLPIGDPMHTLRELVLGIRGNLRLPEHRRRAADARRVAEGLPTSVGARERNDRRDLCLRALNAIEKSLDGERLTHLKVARGGFERFRAAYAELPFPTQEEGSDGVGALDGARPSNHKPARPPGNLPSEDAPGPERPGWTADKQMRLEELREAVRARHADAGSVIAGPGAVPPIRRAAAEVVARRAAGPGGREEGGPEEGLEGRVRRNLETAR